MNFEKDCRHFSGYKPCFPGEDCTAECRRPDPFGTRILIVNLDAMGDVLMTTAQLPGLKRAHPSSTIYWITLPGAAALLQNNPLLDAVFPWTEESRMILQALEFDLVLNGDKSRGACAFVGTLRAREVRGFRLNRYGQIVPANPEAEYNYRLGLDDHLKFRVNRKTGQEILAESWVVPYRRDEYILSLTGAEEEFCAERRREWGLDGKELAVGFNTGCSELYPNKKMRVDQHVTLIRRLMRTEGIRVLLLGGREDAARNGNIREAVAEFGGRVIDTPTGEGLRRGLCYINCADVVVSGDSFGMHAAIALKKEVIAWFGLSCWEEIDLYGRGRKLYPAGLECAPCWKRECPYNLECIDRIDLASIEDEILRRAAQNGAAR